MKWWPAVLVLLASGLVSAEEPAKPNQLTPKEIADGWISLFDGETTFGWKIDGEAKVEKGALILGGEKATTAKTTTEFSNAKFEFLYKYANPSSGNRTPTVRILDGPADKLTTTKETRGAIEVHYKSEHLNNDLKRDPIVFEIPAGGRVEISELKLRPLGYKPIFNGKDLTGWKEFPGKKSKWSVTKHGWIHLEDGPGDLQTEDQWADFILSAECISNGPHCNSGIFFRCIPGQYQQGYEAQIRNEWKDDDRTKPVDFGTGAIYRRQAARKVVSSDHEWFTMTIAAHGNHLATWVNGYQVTDFTDTRPPNDNARNGSKTGKGAISLQGHDPTTNLDFRNIRIVELPSAQK
ncbi:MAG TPA: DUF1080 domain-containing protein [Gemmataceae bacterium]|nr:DUF1080 domain-containing protein [Gemmataceae bacterium]